MAPGGDDLAVGVEGQGAAAGRDGDEAQTRHAEAGEHAAHAGEEVAASRCAQAVVGFVVAVQAQGGFFFEFEAQVDRDRGRLALDLVGGVGGAEVELECQRLNRLGHAQQAHKVAAFARTGGHGTGGGGVDLFEQV